jgi:putative addiction module CopG family antidote
MLSNPLMSTVPPEFTPFVENQISSGRFKSLDEVVAAGLKLLQDREERLEALRSELRPSIEELDRGGGIRLNDEELDQFFTRLMSEVDAKLDAEAKR